MPDKNSLLAIIGQGYVGLPLAIAAVEAGWHVVGVDLSVTRVLTLNKGVSPIEDVSSQQLQNAIARGFYNATTDFKDIAAADVIAICVPTPLDSERKPDLQPLLSAVRSIEPYVKTGALVVSESTSYPGTLRNEIVPIFNQNKSSLAREIFFAVAPERVNPGDQIWNQKNTPRLVGGLNTESSAKALDFYSSICDAAICVSSPEIAEAAKLLENTFRLVNIALIHELTQICDTQSIDIHQVIDAAATKPYGFMPFRPGVGIGGHCIPVDPLYLTWWANKNGKSASLVIAADQISQNMPTYVAERVMMLGPQQNQKVKVMIIGVAYKSGISDVRETPAKALRDQLLSRDCIVKWHDPLVENWEGSDSVNISWDCDVAVVVTNQPGIDIQFISNKGIPILDCTNSYSGLKGVTLI
jgi:UDP-N-acetyl-D-glucosamine dehydrogenase